MDRAIAPLPAGRAVSAFVCAVPSSGHGEAASLLAHYTSRLAKIPGQLTWSAAEAGFAGAATSTPTALRPFVEHLGQLTGLGDVRLDNRLELTRGLAISPSASDLAVVLATFAARGEACIHSLVGDFGFVLWDGRTRDLYLIRDALGVKPLYFRRTGEALIASSRPSLLSEDGGFDPEYVADFLMGGYTVSPSTMWKGCSVVPAGHYLVQRGSQLIERRYWSAYDFTPTVSGSPEDQVAEFRALFSEAVRVRLTGGPDTWAQLSGGLDSSSVVCMAAELVSSGQINRGISGTVTNVDSLGDGDETRFSNPVIHRCGLRNETLHDNWPWEDDGSLPPETEEPRPHYPYWVRDRRMRDLVRHAGGRVLLSGHGSDAYLAGNLNFIADRLARGRVTSAVGDVARYAIQNRTSFWRMLWWQAAYPFYPRWLKARSVNARERVPDWIAPEFARQTRIWDHMPSLRQLGSRGGEKFAGEIAHSMNIIAENREVGVVPEAIEMRYPFLSRPLVEFSLRLSPEMRIRPGCQKWILREAMRGLLPEEVRTRTAKGGIDARILWALHRERARIEDLLREPLVAELGWVRPGHLRAAVERARQGEVKNIVYLFPVLALETWLAVRSGRWTSLEQCPSTAA